MNNNEQQVERARELVNKGFGCVIVARKLSISEHQARKLVKLCRGQVSPKAQAKKATLWHCASALPRQNGKVKLTGTIKADVFKDSVDDVKRLQQGLEQLSDDVIQDGLFRTDLGISAAAWAQLREKRDFLKNQFRVKGKHYWSSQKTIAEVAKTCPELQTH